MASIFSLLMADIKSCRSLPAHCVALAYSFFNDLVIALSQVIEMTAMHYYTNLMVCNYSS